MNTQMHTHSLASTYDREQFLLLVNAAHQQSGCSLRELGMLTNLNPGYISQILNGHRRPSRDVLIVLACCGWILSLEEIDSILFNAGHKPLSSAFSIAERLLPITQQQTGANRFG